MNIPLKTGIAGFSMPVFGMGTWMIGGETERNPANNDERDIIALRYALHKGVTHIDTAEMYADGHCETLVGLAISGFDRSKLFLASKVWNTNLRHDDVLRSFEFSLKRLGTDYLDLYMIHKPNLEIGMQETFKALNRLVTEKTVRHIGVSNFSTDRLCSALNMSENPIVVNQVHYNLIYREPERSGLTEFCRRNNILISAWRPIQKGLIADSTSQLMRELTEKYNKSHAQIAINWLISQQKTVTISTMRTQKHLDDNLDALNFSMDQSDIERLTNDYPGQQDVSDRVPLS
ncbi:MAG: aldo/keto reductase [Lentisphaerae bacterium]|nr:aldo/keto reductase [Lentisphaerota bacterium]